MKVIENKVEPRNNKKWKGEEECRRVLENVYRVPFESIRPDWLKSPETQANLELDCFAELEVNDQTVMIACEYNGIQHYEYPNTWHKTKTDFDKLRWNDNFKRQQCDDMGIYLIVIPYSTPFEKIEETIIAALGDFNLLP